MYFKRRSQFTYNVPRKTWGLSQRNKEERFGKHIRMSGIRVKNFSLFLNCRATAPVENFRTNKTNFSLQVCLSFLNVVFTKLKHISSTFQPPSPKKRKQIIAITFRSHTSTYVSIIYLWQLYTYISAYTASKMLKSATDLSMYVCMYVCMYVMHFFGMDNHFCRFECKESKRREKKLVLCTVL
jgi:hypothetical protein